MRYVELEGSRISVIGLGAWQFGSREWGYGSEYANKEAKAIIERALDLGVNLVDTAEIYAFGRSERIIGETILGRRNEVFLATKVFPIAPFAPVVRQRAKASLRRLQTDHVDLYQVHWPNPVVPIGSTMQGMRTLLDDALVRHAGVSNFTLRQWRAAEASLGRPVLSNQVRFSLVHRKPLEELVPFAVERSRLVIAYSPLGQGLLSARYDADNRPKGMVRAGNPLFLPENLSRAAGLIQVLRDVAKAHDASPAQIALAWLIRRPNVVAIPGASSVAQLESNAAAADIALTDDEDASLTAAAEAFHPIQGVQALPKIAAARVGLGR
jgi:aryl-alcohol dehydrogenase-like predicted oxidoreductase